jgi:hypothetical protein
MNYDNIGLSDFGFYLNLITAVGMLLGHYLLITFTGAASAFRKMVATFKAPLGRPRGLPDFPFLKRVCLGVRLKPTE